MGSQAPARIVRKGTVVKSGGADVSTSLKTVVGRRGKMAEGGWRSSNQLKNVNKRQKKRKFPRAAHATEFL